MSCYSTRPDAVTIQQLVSRTQQDSSTPEVGTFASSCSIWPCNLHVRVLPSVCTDSESKQGYPYTRVKFYSCTGGVFWQQGYVITLHGVAREYLLTCMHDIGMTFMQLVITHHSLEVNIRRYYIDLTWFKTGEYIRAISEVLHQKDQKEEEDGIITGYRRWSGGRRLNEDVWVSGGVDHYLLGSNKVRVDFGSVLTPSDSGNCGARRTKD